MGEGWSLVGQCMHKYESMDEELEGAQKELDELKMELNLRPDGKRDSIHVSETHTSGNIMKLNTC